MNRNSPLCPFFPPNQRAQMILSPANFWQAFALSCASQHLQETQKETRQQDKTQTLTCNGCLWQLIPAIARRVRPKVAGMRAWASPQVLPSTRPASDKGKRGPLLSLSLPAASVSLCLSIPPLPLCAQVWALTHQLLRQLFPGNEVAPGARSEGGGRTHLRASGRARVAVRRGWGGRGEKKVWEGTSSFVLWSPPFVYTCDRWMGLLLAAPSSFRSPKSPALSKSNNYARRTVDMCDH